MSYYGDIALGDTIDIKFTTRRFSTGAPHTLAGTPSVAAYVGNGTTEITAGITLSVDFDSRTGLNNVRVVATSGNGYAAATNVQLVITAGTVDSVSVVGEVVGSFSIEARSGLRPTVAGRTLDVSAGGEAGVDWANVGSPTTTVTLSGTTVKTATDVETDTADIQSRLPAALVSGRMDSSVGAMAANVLTASAIAADAITAAKVAADVTTEIQSGLATAAALSTVEGKIDTIDTNVDSVLADTNELQTDWANGGRLDNILDARASQTSVDTVDTVVDAIKVTTDKLDDTLEDDAGTYRFTANALEEAPTGGSAPTAGEIADAVWDEVLTGASHNDATSAGRRLRQASQGIVNHEGTAQAGGATSITLDAGASSEDDFYVPGLVVIINGTGAGQSRRIPTYNGTTKVATVATPWVINPDNTSEFVVVPWASVRVSDVDSGALDAIAGEVWSDATRTLTAIDEDSTTLDLDATIRGAVGLASANLDTQLSAIDTVVDTILVDTNELQTDWANGGRLDNILDARASQTSVDTIDSIVDAILADTGTDGVVVADGSKTGYRLSATGVDDILDEVIEGSYTVRQYLRGYAAALLAKASGLDTTNALYRDTGDSKDRIDATVDEHGNRSAVTLDLT